MYLNQQLRQKKITKNFSCHLWLSYCQCQKSTMCARSRSYVYIHRLIMKFCV